MTADTMTIRLAGSSDAAAVTNIYNQGIEERQATFETEPRTPQQLTAQLIERGDRYPTIVVERDAAVIAWAGAGAYHSRPCYDGIAACSVYVQRSARGSGAGGTALAALIAAYEERGFWKLVSRIFPENTASRAMCRAAGFREVGIYERHGKLDGRWRDCVIIERLLGAAVSDL